MPLGSRLLGTGGIAGEVIRNPPVAVVTSPLLEVAAAFTAVSWTYSSPVPRPQAGYQVRLQDQLGLVTLYTSGTRFGSETDFTLDYVLNGGSTYRVQVRVFDGFEWSPWASSTFTVFLSTVEDVEALQSVGSVYEIGINGKGYMLKDGPDRKYRRQSATLESPRFATGDTPFSEAIERYTMVGFSDWDGGAGQYLASRTRSVRNRFWRSEGIDPFDENGLRLLSSTTREVSSAYAGSRAVVASGRVFVQTGDKQITSLAEVGGAATVFNVAGATIIKSMASDGTHWYATDGVSIWRGSSAADPGAAWSAVGCDVIEWATDRLVGTYVNGSGAGVFTSFAPAGTEEVASGRFNFPAATITTFAAAEGYVWFSVQRGDRTEIRSWQLGADPTSVSRVAADIPAGESVTSIGSYLGNLFVRASCSCVGGGTRAIIYRGVTTDGTVVLSRLTGIPGSGVDHGPGTFGGSDRFGFFSWRSMTADGRSGVGAIDLAGGGWATWFAADDVDASGAVTSIVDWKGRVAFVVAGSGLWVQGDTPVPTGWVRSSIDDLGSGLSKVLNDIQIITTPLPGSASVEVRYSLDNGQTYLSAGAPLDSGGSMDALFPIGHRVASFGIEVTLNADTISPVLTMAQLRVHPLSLADRILVLPVNCADQLTGMNGQTLPDSGPGAGMRRARELEALMSTRIKLQDVDWPWTRIDEIWEVVGVDVQMDGVFDRSKGRRVDSGVCVLTLRRSAT